MPDMPTADPRPSGPADLLADATPELLLCEAVVRTGLVDGCGASLVSDSSDRYSLAATDDILSEAADMQFSLWEGAGPEAIAAGDAVVVSDVWAEAARWPLTAEHAGTLPMRALAVLPLRVAGSTIGLFAAYRRTPTAFSGTDLAVLDIFAGATAALALQRVDESGQWLLPLSPISIAIGMVMGHHHVDAKDAVAILRARAYATNVSVDSVARALVAGSSQLTDGAW